MKEKKGNIDDATFLKHVREQFGMTQHCFAAESGISYSTIANIESQVYPMTFNVRERIKNYCEIHSEITTVESCLKYTLKQMNLDDELIKQIAPCFSKILPRNLSKENRTQYYEWMIEFLNLIAPVCERKADSLRNNIPMRYTVADEEFFNILRKYEEKQSEKKTDKQANTKIIIK